MLFVRRRVLGSIPALVATLALVGASAEARAGVLFDVQEIFIGKFVDFEGGVIVSPDPYAFEACVVGPAITGMTLTVPTTSPRNDPAVQMGDEWCVEAEFATDAAMTVSYPAGSYLVTIAGPGGNQTKTLVLNAAEPGSYLDVTSPTNGASAQPFKGGVDITWTETLRSGFSCSGSCGTTIEVGLENANTFDEAFSSQIASSATNQLVPEPSLSPLTPYDLELALLNGALNPSDTTDQGDPVATFAVYASANSVGFTTSAQSTLDVATLAVQKGVDYADGILESNAYSAELCAEGQNITGGSVSVPTTPMATVLMLQDLGGGEWCTEASFADASSLDAAFPTGDYLFTITDGIANDTKTVSFNETEPGFLIDFTSPADGATDVAFDSGIDFTWTLQQTPYFATCNPFQTCNDRLLLTLDDVGQGMSAFDMFLANSATNQLVASNLLSGLTSYEVEASVWNGDEPTDTTTDLGDPIRVAAAYEVVNIIAFTTAAVPLVIEEFIVSNLIDRDDGVLPMVEPYFHESCVRGSGIVSATLTYPGSGGAVALTDRGDEWCLEEGFADAAGVAAAYPAGNYTFNVTSAADSDSKTVSFSPVEPEAYPAITNPLDGSTVTPNQDLTVMWNLVEKGMSSCLSAGPCADFQEIFLIPAIGPEVEFIDLPIGNTSQVLSGSDLPPSTAFELEVETVNGVINLSDTSDMGRTVRTVSIYEDINLVTFLTPEPGAGLTAAAALFTLLGLRTRVRRAR